MAKGLKGITVQIDGNTQPLNKALSTVNATSKSLQQELKGVNSLLKLDPSNTELAAQKQKILSDSISETEKKLQMLQQAQKEAAAAGKDINDDGYRDLQREIVVVTNKLKELQKEKNTFDELQKKAQTFGQRMSEMAQKVPIVNKLASAFTNVKEKITTATKENEKIQKISQFANDAREKVGKFAEKVPIINKLGTAFGVVKDKAGELAGHLPSVKTSLAAIGSTAASVAGNVLKIGFTAMGAAAGAAATALTGLAVSGGKYADDILTISTNTGIAADSLQKYQYALNFIDGDIETLTKTMEKQKQQMGNAVEGNKAAVAAYERLGISVKNADGSFRDSEEVYWEVIDALGQVTDEVERDNLATDLLGKSSKDLRTIIEAGSEAFKEYGEEAEKMGVVMSGDNLSALGAFDDKIQQLKAGLGGLKNAAATLALPFLDKLASDGVEILQTFNAEMAAADGDMGKMAEAAGNAATSLLDEITSIIPELADIATEIVIGLAESIVANLPALTEAAVNIIQTLLNGIVTMIPTLTSSFMQIIPLLLTAIATLLPQIITAGADILVQLISGISSMIPTLIQTVIELIPVVVNAIMENLPKIVQAGLDLLMSLISGIVQAIPQLVAMLPTIITTIVSTLLSMLPQIIEMGITLLSTLISGIVQAIPQLIAMLPTIISTIVNVLIQNLPQIISAGIELIGALISGLIQAIPALVAAIPQIVSAIFNTFKAINWAELGKNIIDGVINGVKNAASSLINVFKDLASSALDAVKDFFGIHSPSTRMRDEVGKMIPAGMAIGVEEGMDDEEDRIQAAMRKGVPTTIDSYINMQQGSRAANATQTTAAGFTQNVTINSPKELSPSETARQTRNATRQMILKLQPT